MLDAEEFNYLNCVIKLLKYDNGGYRNFKSGSRQERTFDNVAESLDSSEEEGLILGQFHKDNF